MTGKHLACLLVFVFIASLKLWSMDKSTDAIIIRAEQQVSSFLEVFSEVKCTEEVEQTKLNRKGKIEYEENSRYDYLLIAQGSDGDLSLEESRLQEGTTPHKKNVSLLVSNGFATLLLVFHPYYAGSYEFSRAEDDILNGRPVAKIHFRHIKGMRTPTVLLLRGREYPLEMMGTAWMDRNTGSVERIRAELQSSMEDIGLRTLSSDVVYAPVPFRGMKETPWLPAEATIEVETPRQHWRNIHRFTNYQHFAVNTEHQDKIPDSLKVPR
jgi:hypothetical protein